MVLSLVFTLLCQALLRRFFSFIFLSLFLIFTLGNQPFFPLCLLVYLNTFPFCWEAVWVILTLTCFGSILYKLPQGSRCGPFQSELHLKAPAKRSQDVNATYRNTVGSNILHPFGLPFVTCCEMLRDVGCFWLKFENGQIFDLTFVHFAWCCSRLARFVQRCCARACA